MKKLINRPEDVVVESLAGMAAAHGDLISVNVSPHYITRADAPVAGKVALVSGGGSGHEPMHGGFVGKGMLDAACPGEVFTSPTPDQMLSHQGGGRGAGVLHIVKNYTGDVMNFEMAADMAAAEGTTSRRHDRRRRRREGQPLHGRSPGVGGTVLLEKICEAPRRTGGPRGCHRTCNRVNDRVRSMGMALTSCTVPAAGKPTSAR